LVFGCIWLLSKCQTTGGLMGPLDMVLHFRS
jgi:hypothetical protein